MATSTERSTSASQAYISFQVAQKYLESLHETLHQQQLATGYPRGSMPW